MVLIFRQVLIAFTISSFEFIKSNLLDFIDRDEWPPIHPASSTGLSRLGAIL